MGEHLTIADSKRAFHSAFPHVIPSLYRRTADELLVELHLLSHQKQFNVDALFAVGLRQVFEAFTRGYRPEAHLDSLFAALCSCNGFDPVALKQLALDSENAVQGHSFEDVQQWLRDKGDGAPEAITKVLVEEGYLKECVVIGEGVQKALRASLRYEGGRQAVISDLQRISRPSLRVYVGADEAPRVRRGTGISILSTNKGVMTDREARKQHVGGEVLCAVW